LGHATYFFSRPESIEAFLAAYAPTTRAAIRQNRDNVAERLGFLFYRGFLTSRMKLKTRISVIN
jgi:hypothetical protein